MKIPKVLDAIADKVLRYRPKIKTTPARRRKLINRAHAIRGGYQS